MLIGINDINDERIAVFFRINERQLRLSAEYGDGVFVAESALVINRALDKGYEPVSFMIMEGSYDEYAHIFKRIGHDLPIYEASEEVFKSLKGFVLIKGIIGLFKRKKEADANALLERAKRICVLENVQNPTNIGAIFRNAAALYCDGIILSDDCADPLYKRSIRVSMGNVFNIDWCYLPKNEFLSTLKAAGFKTVSFALRDHSVDIQDEKLNKEEKLAIIMGSEGYGLNPLTIDNSDYVVRIAMNSQVDSLNVASASGIALWQLCKNNH